MDEAIGNPRCSTDPEGTGRVLPSRPEGRRTGEVGELRPFRTWPAGRGAYYNDYQHDVFIYIISYDVDRIRAVIVFSSTGRSVAFR